jgi:hypothetical protein
LITPVGINFLSIEKKDLTLLNPNLVTKLLHYPPFLRDSPYQRERDHWGDQDLGGRIILRLIFRKLEGVVGTG